MKCCAAGPGPPQSVTVPDQRRIAISAFTLVFDALWRSAASGTQERDVMTGPEVLDVARDAIITLVLVSAPLMLVGLVVGVIISLFQALTQIQEMTLVFVPKILAIFVAMLIALPFMGDLLQGHMTRLAARIMAG
jgi:flagellar biosynthesis protein FliQ